MLCCVSVCLCVRPRVREIYWTDFYEIWHEVRRRKCKTTDRARFLIFDFCPDIWPGQCRKWPVFEVFGDFLKNGSNDFANFLICCSSNRVSSSKKNRMFRKNLVRKISRPDGAKNRQKSILSLNRIFDMFRWFWAKVVCIHSI